MIHRKLVMSYSSIKSFYYFCYCNFEYCISRDEEKEKHTLTFNIYFPHDQDVVYLSHCYPYTYTDLQVNILSL